MILTELRPDEMARVSRIAGGQAMRQQLSLRGCSEGCILRMIDSRCGPVLINIRGNTLAIGRRMAEKILVELC